MSDLVSVNVDPLIKRFSSDVDRWSSLHLSMIGKVNVIKMSCISKFNYMLQSLSIDVPLSYFKQFESIAKSFIWNGKRPRLNFNKLHRPIDKGELGLLKILFYYYAFGLRHLAYWSLPP